MFDGDGALSDSGLSAELILQVHDELVFEVPEDEVDALTALAREKMVGALPLEVPLVMDVGVGRNWREAH